MKYALFPFSMFFILLISCISCNHKLENKVRAYELAHNAHDIDKVMSLYSDDITFEIVGAWRLKGKEAVRGVAEWDQATNSNMSITNIEVNNDTVTFDLKEGNDWFRTIGIEHMYYQPSMMVFKDGLISELKAQATPQSMKSFGKIWPSVFKWLSQEKSEELSNLVTSKGQFIYNFENAKTWLSLLDEWKEQKEKSNP